MKFSKASVGFPPPLPRGNNIPYAVICHMFWPHTAVCRALLVAAKRRCPGSLLDLLNTPTHRAYGSTIYVPR